MPCGNLRRIDIKRMKPNNKQPSTHRLAVLTWVGVYPVLTGIALAMEPLLSGRPVAMRTLVMSAMMVPIMVYGVMPLIHRFVLRSREGGNR